MINYVKIFFLKRRLKKLYKRVQGLTSKKFSLRMKSIELGNTLLKTVLRLEELGLKNPKELILGERPPTGKIK